MNPNPFSRLMSLSLATILILTACGSSATPVSMPVVETQPSVTPESQAEPTATLSSTSTTESAAQESATPETAASTCTVLQDLNLRLGPGTAYRPPLSVLPQNTVVTPLGFTSQGIPGGSWVFVQDPTSQEEGWVSAGAQYVSCDVEPSTLPPAAFGTPPPPPLPKSAVTSTPEGNCGDQYQCDVIFTDEAFIQFRVIKGGKALTEEDGVEQVTFTVRLRDGSADIYTNTETASAYCIFGGNVPCNPWDYEGYVYKWAGGEIAQSGEYNVAIDALVNGESLRWSADFKLTLP